MSTLSIIGLVVLFCLVALILLVAIGFVVAWAYGGKRPQSQSAAPVNPFFAQFESALQTVNANARVKAQQYDLAQQQALYDRVMTHDSQPTA